MYIGYLQDREKLNFIIIENNDCVTKPSGLKVKILGGIVFGAGVYFNSFDNFEIFQSQKSEINRSLQLVSGADVGETDNSTSTQSQKSELNRSLQLVGGADVSGTDNSTSIQTQKVIDKVLKKLDPERQIEIALKISDTSLRATVGRIINETLKYLENHPDIIKNSLIMLKEFQKPSPVYLPFERLAPYDRLGILQRQSLVQSKDLKLLIKSDFEDRMKKQQILNAREPEVSVPEVQEVIPRDESPRLRYVNEFKDLPKPEKRSVSLPETKSRSAIQQDKKFGSKPGIFVEGLQPIQFKPGIKPGRGRILGAEKPTGFFPAHSSPQPGARPTPEVFGADLETDQIQDIGTAFREFQKRMTAIANSYTGEKRDNFLKQLEKCSLSRFESLATETQDNSQTVTSVREAEALLQSEFEGYHEPDSITLPTYDEFEKGNPLDGRFRKGLLSGESDTLNGDYTDVDVKLLVSEKTLKYQADLRKNLGHKNPEPITMFEQGERTGYSIIIQKYKHCNRTISEKPSGPKNVEHIVTCLELLKEETPIATRGLIQGAKRGLAEKLNVAKDSISDQRALEGVLLLNEDYTIERIN